MSVYMINSDGVFKCQCTMFYVFGCFGYCLVIMIFIDYMKTNREYVECPVCYSQCSIILLYECVCGRTSVYYKCYVFSRLVNVALKIFQKQNLIFLIPETVT